ncbi:MAG: hypothetical protein QUT30_09005 [Acidobacteriota bacterium]|jgi:hypothetical protein|nr:hypothetical protein [Acidobacteriota bacterium]
MDTSIALVLTILAATVILLVFEIFRIDVAAIVCMLALGWTGILAPSEILSGFAEAIVPSRSELVGQTIRKYSLRKRYAVEPIL